jgi:hypothetical protein
MRWREMRRQLRLTSTGLGWVFVASPVLVLLFGRGRYSVAEAAFMPVIGVAILLWLKARPARWPEHLASVEHVRPDESDGPDARTTPFYLAWCDCGWLGDDQPSEEAARLEAREHTPHVRDGLRAWGA